MHPGLNKSSNKITIVCMKDHINVKIVIKVLKDIFSTTITLKDIQGHPPRS